MPMATIYIGPGVISLSVPLVPNSEFASLSISGSEFIVNSLSANLRSLESLWEPKSLPIL